MVNCCCLIAGVSSPVYMGFLKEGAEEWCSPCLGDPVSTEDMQPRCVILFLVLKLSMDFQSSMFKQCYWRKQIHCTYSASHQLNKPFTLYSQTKLTSNSKGSSYYSGLLQTAGHSCRLHASLRAKMLPPIQGSELGFLSSHKLAFAEESALNPLIVYWYWGCASCVP